MSYSDTRTAKYEEHLLLIQKNREVIEPYTTAARHYDDVADDILQKIRPFKNADGQAVVDDIIVSIRRRAEKCRRTVETAQENVRRLEEEGIG